VIFSKSHDPASVVPLDSLQDAFNYWKCHSTAEGTGYPDVHCSVFTPTSFELLVSDLLFLKLIQLQLIEVRETEFHEFFAHFRRPTMPLEEPDRVRFYERRASLLHKVNSEAGINSVEAFRMRSALEHALHEITEQEKRIAVIQKQAQDFRNESLRNLNEVKAEMGALRASKSWRLTAPLRAMAGLFRRWRRSPGYRPNA
jgi:hypothetical protein